MKTTQNCPASSGSSPSPCSPSSDYVPYGPEWEAEITRLPKKVLVPMLRNALLAKQASVDAVPTSWLDDLLSGPDAALKGSGGTWGCPDIERLLNGVRDRISSENAELSQPSPKNDHE